MLRWRGRFACPFPGCSPFHSPRVGILRSIDAWTRATMAMSHVSGWFRTNWQQRHGCVFKALQTVLALHQLVRGPRAYLHQLQEDQGRPGLHLTARSAHSVHCRGCKGSAGVAPVPLAPAVLGICTYLGCYRVALNPSGFCACRLPAPFASRSALAEELRRGWWHPLPACAF